MAVCKYATDDVPVGNVAGANVIEGQFTGSV
jgi:hypothetical protein